MRRYWAVAAGFAALVTVTAPGQELQRLQPLPAGRGLLPKPPEMPTTLEGAPPAHPFRPDQSGGLSRTILETDEDPNFKIVIREFSFPPDRQPHTITAPSSLLLQLLGEPGDVKIAGQPLALRAGERTAVAAKASIEIINKGERSVVMRLLIVEAK